MVDDPHKAILQQLYNVVEPVVDDLGLELVELIYRREQSGLVLRIIIYNSAGIGIDDCSRVSREVSTILDVEDIIPQHYTLEVTSPGLSRPLKIARDFERNIGSKIKLTLSVGKEIVTREAMITAVDGDVITVENDNEVSTFSIEQLKKAKIIL